MAPAAQALYQPLRVIGTGGMGTVVLARDRAHARLVALKFLRETCTLFLGRFRREARLMARLRHPSIVPLLGFEDAGPRPFLVLEYVRGGNLALARLEPLELARTLRGIVAALAHAHAHGIVHRDVKPENVLLDGRGQALLTDFGLALEPREGLLRSHTQARPAVAGTLQAMSPEQARGDALGPASDQFSLGATFYRALTGEWPHRGRTVGDILDAIQQAEPVPPRVLAPGVPADLERLVLRCLAKDPADRFASMSELGRALARVSARPRPLARFLSRLRPRRRADRIHPPSVTVLPSRTSPLPETPP